MTQSISWYTLERLLEAALGTRAETAIDGRLLQEPSMTAALEALSDSDVERARAHLRLLGKRP